MLQAATLVCLRARFALLLALLIPSLAAQSLTTTFTSNNGGSVGGAVYFDVTVTNPAGLSIHRFDVNCQNPRATPASISVYTTAAGVSHVGNLVGPAPGTWMLRGRATMFTAGRDNPTVAILDKPFVLAPGSYGVAVLYHGAATRYSNNSTPSANGDLTITPGSAQNEPFVSTVFSPREANVRVHYAPATSDEADFTASEPTGASPHLVQFRDLSTAASGAITGWAWDFEDDGTVDSTLQNPAFTYATCGDYSVRLTVTTAAGSTSVVWPDLMSIDPLVADFDPSPNTGPAPTLNVQFTDQSTGTPLSWAWDFDSDGNVDSTLQNPLTTYGPGSYAATLTVTNGCRTSSRTRRVTIASDSLSTGGYNAASFINEFGVVMFDLTVNATEALSICAIDCNSYTPAGNPMAIEVFLTDGSALGKETNPDAWRRVATATGITPGANVPARVVLDRPILLLPGRSYGVGIYHNGNSAYYLNASAPISNADLTLTPVAAAWVPNGPFTVAPQFAPRQWVGELHYLRENSFPQGSITFYAPGCAGSLGVPTLQPVGTSRPQLGTTTTVELDNMPTNVGFLMIGLSNTTSPFGPLPLSLASLGAPGCTGHASPDANVILIGTGGIAQHAISLPNNGTFAGVNFYVQALVLDPGTNALGAVVSDALALLTGSF